MTCDMLLNYSMYSSTNKTDHHDITDILLKVALSTITLTLTHREYVVQAGKWKLL